MTTTSPKDHYIAAFRAAQGSLPGRALPWLVRLRTDALARFADLGFPTPRDEDWKYTRTTAIENQSFRLAERTDGLRAEHIHAYALPPPAHLLVFVNGHFNAPLSRLETLPAGVEVMSLDDALSRYPDEMERHLNAGTANNAFAALNTGLMAGGAYLRVSANTVLAEPVHLLFLSTENETSTMAHVRNVLVVEDHARATIVESYAGPDSAIYLTNAVTQVVTGRNASIEHYKLQQEGLKAFHVADTRVFQGRDSRFASHSISLGGVLVRNDLATLLSAPGSECTFNGLYIATGRQHVDNHTLIDHATAHGTSREFYKGILDGRARAVFNGRVVVRQDAQKTDAQQTNKNLLLSEDAEIDTKPQLEIYADDVKCAHGATVGQLNKDALYYLRSRGIDEATARGVLTYAFASEVIERMMIVPLRARLEEQLVARLPNSQRIKEFV